MSSTDLHVVYEYVILFFPVDQWYCCFTVGSS